MIPFVILSGSILFVYLIDRYYSSVRHSILRYKPDKENTLFQIIECFDLAKNEIKLRQGEFGRVFSTKPRIINSLKKALDRGVKLRIIFGPYLDIEGKPLYKLFLAYPDQVAIRRCFVRKMPHFQLVDNTNSAFLIFENKHDPFYPKGGLVGKIKPHPAESLEAYFDRLWEEGIEEFDLRRAIENVSILKRNQIKDYLTKSKEKAYSFGFVDFDEDKNIILPANKEKVENLRQELSKSPEELYKEVEKFAVGH